MFRRQRGDTRPSAAEPAPVPERVRPDESVLDELSRAFGVPDDGAVDAEIDDEVDDEFDDEIDDEGTVVSVPGVDLPGRRGPDTADSEGVAVEPEPLHIVSDLSTGPVPTTPRPADRPPRRTIVIGGDDLGVADARPIDRSPAGRSPVARDLGVAGRDDGVRRGRPERPAPATTAGSSRSTIAIGGGDDLPDAVYLDDAGDDSGGTVFIDDDGIGDAVAPKDAAMTGIEPRLRQRRIGVRRAAGRRRLKWVVLGAAVLVVVLGGLTVLGSGWFAVDSVAVTGAVYTDPDRLEEIVAEVEGTPVLLLDTEDVEARLEAIPWVEAARVSARFPDSATIEIRERRPVATMRGADGRFRVLDDEGRILDVIDGQPVAYVLIAGPGTLDQAAGDFAPIGPSSAASLVTKLTPTIRPRVESILVTDDGADLVMVLAPGPDGEQTSSITVRFGSAIGDSDQIEKLVRLERRLDDLPEGPISEIDVATDEVTVR